jgi:hypothetical protein
LDRRCFLLTSLAGVLAAPLGAEAQHTPEGSSVAPSAPTNLQIR